MPLRPAPAGLATTRDALHAVAEHVLAPARVQATGNEIALQPRAGGVGTPDFPGGGWVAFSGTSLLVADAAGTTTETPLTTLRAAGEAAGLKGAAGLSAGRLDIDADAAVFLGDVYEFALGVLTTLRSEAAADDDASPILLWPEHFDIAYEQGAEASGARAGYGVSPGDEHHDEPYAYVGPWAGPKGPADLWQATGFAGAELAWGEIAAAADPEGALLEFWRTRRDAIQ